MLARLAIDPAALAETVTPVSLTKVLHNNLLETIASHGYLVFANNEEANAFVNAIRNHKSFPPGMAEKWGTFLPELHKQGRISLIAPPGDHAIAEVRELDELERGWKGNLDVAVLCNANAAALGISDEDGILDDANSHVELATFGATPHTRIVAHYRELTETALLPYNADREGFWNEVLRPVAAASKKATVLDGYLLTSLWKKEDNLPRSRRWDIEHVAWMLDHLDSTMRARSEVELICAYEPHKLHFNAEASAALIRKWWAPTPAGRISKVALTLIERQKGFTHDRHIRFSTGVAITIPAGFDRLRSPRVWDEDGMAWAYKWRRDAVNGLREREERAKTFPHEQTVTVFER